MAWNKSVEQTARKLRKGQGVEIIWEDACVSRNVSSLKNEDFATYKKTIGRFLALKRDRAYGRWHIILCEEVTDGKYFEITSIPLAVVMNIRVMEERK